MTSSEIITPAISERDIQYAAKISENGYSLFLQPFGTVNNSQLDTSRIANQELMASKEVETSYGTWVRVTNNVGQYRWINKNALEILSVTETRDIRYMAEVTKPWSINSAPWGTYDFRFLTDGAQHIGRQVEVVQEQVTPRSTYALIKADGKELGWIDTTGIEALTVSSTTDVNYTASIVSPWSINSEPWGVAGFEQVASGHDYLGQQVDIIQEKVTQRSTYSLIQVDGVEIGWIDKRALDTFYKIHSTIDTNYVAKITKPWSINTRPWGTYDSKEAVANTFVGKVADVIQEKVTDRSTYALLVVEGVELGWIDMTGLEKLEVTSTKNITYDVKIAKAWSINTQPWGIEGYELVDDGSGYVGKNATIVQEKTTQRSTYALLQVDGESIGWIDKGALDSYYNVLSTTNINYMAEVTKPWSINTQPWGTAGAEEAVVNNLVGQVVEIIQEKTTEKSTYALIVVDGEELGWIDKTGIDQYRSLFRRDTHYLATIMKPWSINTAPWGTAGAKLIENDTSFVGQDFLVTEERITQKGMYAKLESNSDVLGWIDATGISAYSVTSTRHVSYKAQIVKPWSINTQPWGTLQYQPIENADSYLWNHVEIVQEKTTRKATYGLIKYYGEYVGWIDVGALRR